MRRFKDEQEFVEAMEVMLGEIEYNDEVRFAAIVALTDAYLESFGERVPNKYFHRLNNYALQRDLRDTIGRKNLEYPFLSNGQIKKRHKKEQMVYSTPDNSAEDYLSYVNRQRRMAREMDALLSDKLAVAELIQVTDLTDKEEEVVQMVYFEEIAAAQAARELGITRMSVNSRLQKAFKKLREVAERMDLGLVN